MPFNDDEDDIYQEHILDHYEDPYHRGECKSLTHSHRDKNPLCGDVIRVGLSIQEGRIVEAWFDGEGCVVSQASASMLMEKLEGKTLDEVRTFPAEEMLDLYGARLTPNRQKCCLLSWRVVQSALHSPVEAVAGNAATGDVEAGDAAAGDGVSAPPQFDGSRLGEES
jgi:nitrogen fixation NifU-like protein